MRIETTDPITGNTIIKAPEGHPFVIEGGGEGALKIFFETEESKSAYLDVEVEHLPEGISAPISIIRSRWEVMRATNEIKLSLAGAAPPAKSGWIPPLPTVIAP